MGAYTKLLSIIVPCYNEEESVPLFYQEAIKQETFFHKKDVELELIFVDDGSKDKTVEEVKKLREKDERIHLVSFSRNFGKEAAIIAGLEKAKGDFTVLMDADLQDPPALLPEMYGYIEQGYDSVATSVRLATAYSLLFILTSACAISLAITPVPSTAQFKSLFLSILITCLSSNFHTPLL